MGCAAILAAPFTAPQTTAIRRTARHLTHTQQLTAGRRTVENRSSPHSRRTTMFKSILSFIFCLSMLPTGARADVIPDWGASASTFIAAASRSGPSLILDFAVVHGAMYDAVDAYDGRYEP